MYKITLLPLDERHCNYNYPLELCASSGNYDLNIISKELLGVKKTPAKFENIKNFLLSDEAIKSDAYIISIDMLLYGGLIPSRLHYLTIEELTNRLDVLKQIKQSNDKVKIYAFSCIMRNPKYNSADEEPDYYAEHGYNLYRKKFLEDKQNTQKLNETELNELKAISIPLQFVQDYEERRQINKTLNLKTLELLNTYIDYLIIPQDDSSEFGYTRIDQTEIYDFAHKYDDQTISIHPGADEAAMTLLGRINAFLNKKKKIFIWYTNPETSFEIPNYEDRALYKSLELHIKAAGLTKVTLVDEADLILVYNTPETYPMKESFEQVATNRDFSATVEFIKANNKQVIFVDKAYSNGGDYEFVTALDENDLFKNCLAYFAWNTNSNSLGCALAAGSILENTDQKYIATSIIENCYYQAVVRSKITNDFLPNFELNYFTLMDKQNLVVEKEKELLLQEMKKNQITKQFTNHQIILYHPWNRMFEIGLSLKEK